MIQILRLKLLPQLTKSGLTPLEWAAIHGRVGVLKRLLLEKSAGISPRDNVSVLHLMLEDIKAKDDFEDLVKSYEKPKFSDWLECFRALIEDPRIDINAEDADGRTARYILEDSCCLEKIFWTTERQIENVLGLIHQQETIRTLNTRA